MFVKNKNPCCFNIPVFRLDYELFLPLKTFELVTERLRENIAFWQSIGASQWLLNVLCEGYCLPFVGFPVNKFFPNHM